MEAACCCGSEPKAEQSVQRPAALVPVLARVCCSCRVLRLMPRFIPARLLLKKLTEGLEAGWGVGEARGEVTVGGGVVAEASRRPAGDSRVLIA